MRQKFWQVYGKTSGGDFSRCSIAVRAATQSERMALGDTIFGAFYDAGCLFVKFNDSMLPKLTHCGNRHELAAVDKIEAYLQNEGEIQTYGKASEH